MLETKQKRTSETPPQFKATTALLKIEITQEAYFPITKIPSVAQTKPVRMSNLSIT